MTQLLWHFIVGMIVSFIGSIPLGSINLSTLQITLEKNTRAGLEFATGATLVELIYSTIAIKFSAFLMQHKHIEIYIHLIAIPAFIGLSIHSFRKKQTVNSSPKVRNKSNFFKGIIIGLVNPLQIPFWVAYGTYMLSNNWIENNSFLLDFFILGIVSGTFLLLSLVVFLSHHLNARLNLSRFNIDKLIGVVFLSLACYQFVKLVF